MATAYFVNGTPTTVKITLNGGDQRSLLPISVAQDKKSVTGPAWGAVIAANKAPDVFGSDNAGSVENEFLFSSSQSGVTRRYHIISTVSNVLDLYFFMFEDSIIGEDQTGSSKQITIAKMATLHHEL